MLSMNKLFYIPSFLNSPKFLFSQIYGNGCIYYLWISLVVIPNDFINENEKINAFINKILWLIDNFENFEQTRLLLWMIKQEQKLID